MKEIYRCLPHLLDISEKSTGGCPIQASVVRVGLFLTSAKRRAALHPPSPQGAICVSCRPFDFIALGSAYFLQQRHQRLACGRRLNGVFEHNVPRADGFFIQAPVGVGIRR